ncbi:MAG: flippase-like domain-containing protein [Bacteroidetes bacterium]|nr:flippase-like domain-containing protein [Bacteroidota bacterium]
MLCFFFLFKKLKKINLTEFDELIFSSLYNSWHLLVLVMLLFFINWGIEAYKWKFIIRKTQKISFLKSFAAVLGGVAVSSFTPNRTGEFAGRMLFLKNKLIPEIITLTIFGSISQLFITFLAGLPGFYIFLSTTNYISFINFKNFLILFLFFAVVVILFFLFNLNKIKGLSKKLIIRNNILTQITHAFALLNLKDICILLSLSFFRYLVFLLQFAILLQYFKINLEFNQVLLILPAIFLFQTVIPSFLLSEIGIRMSIAITLLAPLGFAHKNIIASSTLLWIINIMIAAIAGALAILFYKTSKK